MLHKTVVALAAVTLVSASAGVARAQDEERPGDSRGGYAWGSGSSAASEPDDPLRIMAFVGAGLGFRPLRNLDPPFNQDFLAPAYLDLGAAVYLPGAEVRHGVGLAISTNLSQDVNSGVPIGQQWALTPAYHLLLPLRRLLPDMQHDLVQIQIRAGIPLVIGSALGTNGGGVDVSVGGELGVAAHFKFLAGFGAYVELQGAIYGGTHDTVHPLLSADVGLMIDYEVLP